MHGSLEPARSASSRSTLSQRGLTTPRHRRQAALVFQKKTSTLVVCVFVFFFGVLEKKQPPPHVNAYMLPWDTIASHSRGFTVKAGYQLIGNCYYIWRLQTMHLEFPLSRTVAGDNVGHECSPLYQRTVSTHSRAALYNRLSLEVYYRPSEVSSCRKL